MKTFIALGALAALCQSAFGLTEGSYTIGSASLESNQVLSEIGQSNSPLGFSPINGDPSQTWLFTLAGSNNQRDFLIQNNLGSYINCGDEEGSPCLAGTREEVYTAELVGENSYQLVAKSSGYFLRADGGYLQLAGWDQTPNEEFVLLSTQ
ncbi:uncharacterized protein N7479_004763 [Penicillium vulpinum]|uniref:Ricin B lectin domain-containing protein n=1 Tax=Penicillium vulpinum TaxID=29845 RepID=A0A1V6RT63_9EURO|nr:uncharacterized protein N7479_004763 [Penicillium vulpinum]KAJ5964887.1 hypothetical protein N7479_004763 [Penicillium vulpinum]OQE04669.1 hypothetical protein PENVUL_c031G08140 [Penicillium vulpinum]